jgi:hypothetical protein
MAVSGSSICLVALKRPLMSSHIASLAIPLIAFVVFSCVRVSSKRYNGVAKRCRGLREGPAKDHGKHYPYISMMICSLTQSTGRSTRRCSRQLRHGSRPRPNLETRPPHHSPRRRNLPPLLPRPLQHRQCQNPQRKRRRITPARSQHDKLPIHHCAHGVPRCLRRV